MSLSCALLATSLHQWARRYLRLAQPARCSPEKRARMRAFFANGVEKMHVPWAVEGLPTLLHLSLFLFFGGLVIFLFNIDQEVFIFVVWWIGLFSMVYGLITFLPIIRQDSPYNSPLSTPAWFFYASIHHVTFKVLALITSHSSGGHQTRRHIRNLYQRWMLGDVSGVKKAAEETASERSSEIDIQILDWTISALGDDDSLKSFFEAIPGFFSSELVKHLETDFPVELLKKFREALCGFLGRTWLSNSVDNSEKLRRLDITTNAMNLIRQNGVSSVLWEHLFEHWDGMSQTYEVGQTLARWCTSSDQSVTRDAQVTIARTLVSVRVSMRERNNSWVTLAARIFGLSERDLRDNIALGRDNLLLAILIRVTRQSLRSDHFNYLVLGEFSKLDIRNTLPRLQHDFCMLWNEIVREARNQGPYTTPVTILRGIRHPYLALHQGTDAAPTAFSSSTHSHDYVLYKPSSYPLCNLASHRPLSIAHIPVHNSRQFPLPTSPGNSPDALSPSPTDASSTVPHKPSKGTLLQDLRRLIR